uniref:Uncharacterized protein n=1 Tax=Rhizophora mucronata TaxID=61149 RepID=A0A2P2PME5_RHIMU
MFSLMLFSLFKFYGSNNWILL